MCSFRSLLLPLLPLCLDLQMKVCCQWVWVYGCGEWLVQEKACCLWVWVYGSGECLVQEVCCQWVWVWVWGVVGAGEGVLSVAVDVWV
jgi:hypothetical protein